MPKHDSRALRVPFAAAYRQKFDVGAHEASECILQGSDDGSPGMLKLVFTIAGHPVLALEGEISAGKTVYHIP
jgi:hypothetical protein